MNSNISQLADDALALAEAVTDAAWEVKVHGRLCAWQRLTVMGLSLTREHAGEAIRCFRSGQRYAAMALDRCFYESMVRTLEWMIKPNLSARHWNAIPPFAAREALLSVGGDESKLPAGVRRDINAYRAKHPEAFQERLLDFATARKVLKRVFGLSKNQFLSDKTAHVDTPSLVVHCRPLVAEDFFEAFDDGIDRREKSLWVKADARVLEVTRLLLLLCQAVISAFKLSADTSAIWTRFHTCADIELPKVLHQQNG